MTLRHGFTGKLKRVAAAILAAAFIVGTISVPVRAEGSEGRVMGFEDYLNNTSGTDYFGHEINLADAEVADAEVALAQLNELLGAAVARGKSYSADRYVDSSKISDALKGKITESKGIFGIGAKKSITLYYGGNFVTVPVDSNMTYQNYQKLVLARDRIQEYVSDHKRTADGLRTIYRGFAVIGNVKDVANPSGSTFTVGKLSGGTIMDSFLDNVNKKGLYYGNGKYDKAIDDSSEPSKFEKAIAEPIGNGAFDLYLWLANWNVDLTMDGLIFGRMSPSYKGSVDFTHFGLEENNPYGIVAAAAYYVLRRILLGVLPVVMMTVLLRQLFQNGQKGRAQLKEMAGNFLVAIVLAFVAPYLIELCIIARDAVLKSVSLGMGAIFSGAGLGGGVGSNVIGLVYVTYKRNPTLLNALVWAASVGSGLVYLVSYLQIALFLAGSVAVLPVVLFIAIWNPKILKDWWNVFFPNLCVPLVDLVLLQVPSVFLLLFKSNYDSTSFGGSAIILGILIIILMWNSLMIRDRVIRLLGFEGFGRAGGGFLATAAMLMMRAARNVGRAARGKGQGEDGGEGGREENDRRGDRDVNRERGALQEEALKGIGGSEVPGGDGQKYDPALGDSTDDYLKELDNEYGVGGQGGGEGAGEIAEGDVAGGIEGPGELPESEEVPEGAEGFVDGELPAEGDGGGGLEDVPVAEGDGGSVEGVPGEIPSGDALGDGVPGEVLPEGEGIADEGPGIAAAAAVGGSAAVTAAVDSDGYIASSDHPQRRALLEDVEMPNFDGKTYGELKEKESVLNDRIAESEARMSGMDRSSEAYRGAEERHGALLAERDAVSDQIARHDFRNGLSSEAAKGRYDNLLRMDAYNEKIRANESEISSLGYNRDTYEKDRRSYVDREKQLSAHVSASRARLGGLSEGTKEYQAEHESLQKMEQARSEVHSRIAQLDRGAGLDKANNAYRENVARMTQTEQSYARAWKVGGMSDRTYGSSRDYEWQTKIDGAHKKLATYRDFDSKRYDGILTPAEREDFYREREVREARERAVRVAGGAARFAGRAAVKTAAISAGTIAATYGAYSGGRTMSGLAMVAGKTVSGAADRAVPYVSAAGDRLGRAYVDAPVYSARPASAGRPSVPSGSGSRPVAPIRQSVSGEDAPSSRGGVMSRGGVTGSGGSTARDLARSAGYEPPKTKRPANKNGTGNASAQTIARNAAGARSAGSSEIRRGRGNASPEVLARSAEGKRGEPRPVRGEGNASPETLGRNSEK